MSLQIKDALILIVLSQQQYFQAILSQSKMIAIFEISDYHCINSAETPKIKIKRDTS